MTAEIDWEAASSLVHEAFENFVYEVRGEVPKDAGRITDVIIDRGSWDSEQPLSLTLTFANEKARVRVGVVVIPRHSRTSFEDTRLRMEAEFRLRKILDAYISGPAEIQNWDGKETVYVVTIPDGRRVTRTSRREAENLFWEFVFNHVSLEPS